MAPDLSLTINWRQAMRAPDLDAAHDHQKVLRWAYGLATDIRLLAPPRPID